MRSALSPLAAVLRSAAKFAAKSRGLESHSPLPPRAVTNFINKLLQRTDHARHSMRPVLAFLGVGS